MRRREFITNGAAWGVVVAASELTLSGHQARNALSNRSAATKAEGRKLVPPAEGTIPVAFAISAGVTIIDFCGPWEVFQDVMLPVAGGKEGEHTMAFKLFTVSEKTEPLRGTGGLQLVPDYTFENVPVPKVVVVPAQRGSAALLDWLKSITDKTDVTMSVCTGAFQLAKAGLLAGKAATTHHQFTDRLAKSYPDIDVRRGLRFVEGDKISTAGGLTSGMDLALRVVDRYYGRKIAQATADYMEYQSKGWIV